MNKRPDTDQIRDLFLNDTPLLDVRAPVEFEKGAFPCSQNIPLLDNEQRAAIGTRYKEQGQDAAIELGWKLATPAIKQQRIEDWLAYLAEFPQGYLYCFRGGLRSRLSQQLIHDAGQDYPFIKGGYKAMRRFLIDELDEHSRAMHMIVIGGRTGSGKTLVIQSLKTAIDLEALANHRGSAFGGQVSRQPTQINFENALAIAVMKQRNAHQGALFFEDESQLIGRLALPLNFLAALKMAPRVILETPLDDRIQITLDDYVTKALPVYRSKFGEELGMYKFREQILGNLMRIRKRLGSNRFNHLHAIFKDALDELERSGNEEAFKPGIQLLLTDYYDPMYDYQLTQHERRELFRGNHDELIAWAENYRPTMA